MKFFIGIHTLLIGLLLVSTMARGADTELNTDRPDQTDSAETISPGSFQIELGFSDLQVDQPGVKIDIESFPQTLVRVGLMDRWDSSGKVRETSDTPREPSPEPEEVRPGTANCSNVTLSGSTARKPEPLCRTVGRVGPREPPRAGGGA